jgi:D-3-phosphoglycerate dehydrogenase / 2-oxoglutarate reductase
MFVTTDTIFNQVSSLKPLRLVNAISELTESERESTSGCIVRLGYNISAKELKLLPNLKFLATITTGLDHIDVTECERRGINLISLKGKVEFLESIKATPEHTWGLLMALMRKTCSAHYSVKNGKWDRRQFFGHELFGKTLGILGYGRVGRQVAQYGLAFGMRILAYDIKNVMGQGIQSVSLDELLSKSDVISIHLPLEEGTKNFINRDQLSKMKRGVFLVNTSRGKIVDEVALLSSLKSGALAGFATDVLSQETEFGIDCRESELVKHANLNDNLIITPHISGSTYESMQRTALFIEEEIKRAHKY